MTTRTKRPRFFAAVAASLIVCSIAHAAQPPIQYGPNLSLKQALRAIGASMIAARKQDLPVVVAVVDRAGQLIALERMDNAELGAIAVAQDKAVSSALYRRPTKVFENTLASGGAGLRILGLRHAIPITGGDPILINGRVCGAIGVAGGTAEQDGSVADAGADSMATPLSP